MEFISVSEAAKRWGVSERSVRNYCAQGRITGAFLTGKTWNIPTTAEKPDRLNKHVDMPKTLLDVLRAEKAAKLHGGIYHRVQIDLTYNSNHIEGSRLTHDQTRFIFETNTIGMSDGAVKVDDVVETANHFKCIDMVIDSAAHVLSEAFIKQLHATLKSGTSNSRQDWFAVGDYKKLPNEVGGMDTAQPEEVASQMKKLLSEYNANKEKSFDDLLDFHYRFEPVSYTHLHRDYSFSGSIIINVTDHKMEFISLGGLLPGLSPDDIRSGISQPRNKNLAEVFHRLRLIESYGTGIRRIFNLYADCPEQPQIEVTPNTFKIVLPNMNAVAAAAPKQASPVTAQMQKVLDYILSLIHISALHDPL